MVASYRRAIQWVAQNDDIEWIADEEPIISVTAALVADLFNKPDAAVIADLKAAVRKAKGKSL